MLRSNFSSSTLYISRIDFVIFLMWSKSLMFIFTSAAALTRSNDRPLIKLHLKVFWYCGKPRSLIHSRTSSLVHVNWIGSSSSSTKKPQSVVNVSVDFKSLLDNLKINDEIKIDQSVWKQFANHSTWCCWRFSEITKFLHNENFVWSNILFIVNLSEV